MIRALLIVTGCCAVVIGTIGIFLPLLPTTAFLILAAACFAKSSPRFHRWLLRCPYLGKVIRDWEEKRCIEPAAKRWALFVVVVTFSISILVVPEHLLRYLLAAIMIACLIGIYRIPVCPQGSAKVSPSTAE